jgi:hypothetical protein
LFLPPPPPLPVSLPQGSGGDPKALVLISCP